LYKLVRSCKHSSIYLYEYVLPPLILHAMRKIARLMESFAKNSYAILIKFFSDNKKALISKFMPINTFFKVHLPKSK